MADYARWFITKKNRRRRRKKSPQKNPKPTVKKKKNTATLKSIFFSPGPVSVSEDCNLDITILSLDYQISQYLTATTVLITTVVQRRTDYLECKK